MYRNFGIGSPMRDETETETETNGDGNGDDDGDDDGDISLPPSPPRGAGVWEDFQTGIGYQPPEVPSNAFTGQPDYVALTASGSTEALNNIIKRQGGSMLLGDAYV